MDSTPASLLERLRRPGDARAWERFVRIYTPLLFQWALRTGLQAADAADLVQDVLAILVRRLPDWKYDPGRSFHRWLYTLAMNLWRDRQRKRQPASLSNDAPVAAEPDDLVAFIEHEYRERLARSALAVLEADFEPKSREVFRQHVLEGRDAADVAAAHGLTAGAVYAIKFRVLARLRQELAGLWE